MIQSFLTRAWRIVTIALALLAGSSPLWAADYPAPKDGNWVIKNFRFASGEVLPELKVHYLTLGEPTGEPVLILHGTTGQAKWWKQQLPAFLAQDAGSQ